MIQKQCANLLSGLLYWRNVADEESAHV